MWRQGDIFIAAVPSIPAEATKELRPVLAEGEVTGHSHRIEQPSSVKLYRDNGNLYLAIVADNATVVHEEHGPIGLPRGFYRVWRQREYSPEAIRIVRD